MIAICDIGAEIACRLRMRRYEFAFKNARMLVAGPPVSGRYLVTEVAGERRKTFAFFVSSPHVCCPSDIPSGALLFCVLIRGTTLHPNSSRSQSWASGIPPASKTNSCPRPTVLTYVHGLQRCQRSLFPW